MKFLKLIILASIIVFIASCTKEKKDMTTTVRGSVRDKTTNTPIAGAKVSLYAKQIQVLGGLSSLVSVTTSDANGNFSYDFQGTEGYSYSIEADKKGYYEISSIAAINIGLNLGVVVKMSPDGYMKIHIKSINDNDFVNLSYPCYVNCSFQGNNLDTFNIYRVRGNEPTEIIWFTYKNEIGTIHRDTIYTPAFDTTLFLVNY